MKINASHISSSKLSLQLDKGSNERKARSKLIVSFEQFSNTINLTMWLWGKYFSISRLHQPTTVLCVVPLKLSDSMGIEMFEAMIRIE